MSQELEIGSLLDHGKYRVVGILGQGGFGITYLAVNSILNKYVAIKEFFPKEYCNRNSYQDTTLHIALQDSVPLVNRLKDKFLKEAKNISRCNHPGIVRTFTVFEDNQTAYYVMDYIEGESLSARVMRGGALSEREAINIIMQVGEALDYLHRKGMTHLDVKPGNIMIRRSDKRAILIDFGLSKQYDASGNQTSTTPSGISHGYAPMEQYIPGGVSKFSPQTDVYSLGATLYYALTGIKPPHAPELIDERLKFPIGFPDKLRPIIAKAMANSKRGRYQSVAAFLDNLRPGKRKNIFLLIMLGALLGSIIFFISAILYYVNTNNNSKGVEYYKNIMLQVDGTGLDKNAGESTVTVANTNVKTFLGDAVYSGKVDSSNQPNGRGVAEFIDHPQIKRISAEWRHGAINKNAYVADEESLKDTIYFKDGSVSFGNFDGEAFYEGKSGRWE